VEQSVQLVDIVEFDGKVVNAGDAAVMVGPAHGIFTPPEEPGEVADITTTEVVIGVVVLLVVNDGMEVAGKSTTKELRLK